MGFCWGAGKGRGPRRTRRRTVFGSLSRMSPVAPPPPQDLERQLRHKLLDASAGRCPHRSEGDYLVTAFTIPSGSTLTAHGGKPLVLLSMTTSLTVLDGRRELKPAEV